MSKYWEKANLAADYVVFPFKVMFAAIVGAASSAPLIFGAPVASAFATYDVGKHTLKGEWKKAGEAAYEARDAFGLTAAGAGCVAASSLFLPLGAAPLIYCVPFILAGMKEALQIAIPNAVDDLRDAHADLERRLKKQNTVDDDSFLHLRR